MVQERQVQGVRLCPRAVASNHGLWKWKQQNEPLSQVFRFFRLRARYMTGNLTLNDWSPNIIMLSKG